MQKRKKPKTERREKPARVERRVRVTFFLVADVRQEINAVELIIYYLHQQYWQLFFRLEYDIPVTGFTHSVLPLTAPKTLGFGHKKGSIFLGQWWSETAVKIGEIEIPSAQVEPMLENVVLFVIDLPVVSEKRKFDEGIVRLKEEIFSAYEMNERPQEEIWIVKQDIYRYT